MTDGLVPGLTASEIEAIAVAEDPDEEIDLVLQLARRGDLHGAIKEP